MGKYAGITPKMIAHIKSQKKAERRLRRAGLKFDWKPKPAVEGVDFQFDQFGYIMPLTK